VRFELSKHPQGSEGWIQDRLGRVTGTGAAAVFSGFGATPGKEPAGYRNYMVRLALERITGESGEDDFSSRDTERGKEQEPFARMAYEAETGNVVSEVGFAYMLGVMAGCSVDGFIDRRRGINEYKCPRPAVHYSYMQLTRAPADHLPQITHGLWVTGAEYCDFTSFCHQFPKKLQVHTIRVRRADVKLKTYEAELLRFLVGVERVEQDLRERAA